MSRQLVPAEAPGAQTGSDPTELVRNALMDSRQRWRDLVTLAADFAFETDEWGRLVFVVPDPALGWSAGSLVGEPAALLLANPESGGGFNPFRPTVPSRRKRAWMRRADGGASCLLFSVAPLQDPDNRIIGARGFGVDLTDYDQQGAQVAASLRRGEVMDHILWRMGKEVLAPRMMTAALNEIVNALGAEGAGVVVPPSDGVAGRFVHQCGAAADAVLETAGHRLATMGKEITRVVGLDGRPLLLAGCQTRFGAHAGLVVWRAPDARGWDADDQLLIGSAANIIRMVLEHEAIQAEMTRQARTDPLTGLLNRRAFFEEIDRHVDRLDREGLPGTLIYADLDNFKAVNDQLGHEAGDLVLLDTARVLRRLFRPTDLVARLGGDEFARLDGADRLTAAERAEWLRENMPAELAKVTGGEAPLMSISVGIATRRPGTDEPIDGLMRRADAAMYDVKRNGRGHWRVSLREGD